MIMVREKKISVLAAKHRDESIRMNSRSGGIFTALSDYFLDNDGIVYGASIEKNFAVKHIRANSKEIRDKMRGSKYVQSSLGDSFQKVKKDLLDDRQVLFTGTSCQIAGLRSFLGKDYKNLVCVDIICHGVPSQKILSDYVQWMNERRKSKVVKVDFRNKKKFGWREHKETLCFADGTEVDSNIYAQLFYGLNIIRPACYECRYKSIEHPGDITIGDFWGIEEIDWEFDDDKGVSLVFINTEKGQNTFNLITENLSYIETGIRECMMQKPLVEPYKEPVSRTKFWRIYRKKGISGVINNYTDYGWKNRFSNFIRKILYKRR